MDRELVYNAIQTPDGTILVSTNRHDYNQHFDKNGKLYIIDGGLEYIRRSNNGDEVSLAVYSDEPHEKIRNVYGRGGYGKNGDEVYRRTLLKDMSDEHLKNSVEYVHKNSLMFPLQNIHYVLLINEIEYRKKNNIIINE